MTTGLLEGWRMFGEFVHMGGHGPYVWTVYCVAVGLLAANYVKFRLDRRRTARVLRAHHANADGLDSAPTNAA